MSGSPTREPEPDMTADLRHCAVLVIGCARALHAWRPRRHNIRDLGPLQGEIAVEPR
jgi:hypothetical protein